MRDSLRSKVIRLAYQNPSLRPKLLPLLGVRVAVEEPKSMKALQSSDLSSATKKLIEEKMRSDPGSFLDKSPGKMKSKKDGEEVDFTPPGYLRDFQNASSSSKEDDAAEKAMREWVASQLKMSLRDLEDWYDLEISDSRSGAFKATIKPSMKE